MPEFDLHTNRAVFASLDKVGADLAPLTAANRTILEGTDAILVSTGETATAASCSS